MRHPSVSDCAGCRDDIYNHTPMGMNEKPDGTVQCWHFATATMVAAKDVPMEMPPPYLRLRAVTRPSCYRMRGFVRVKPEVLDAKGYWR